MPIITINTNTPGTAARWTYTPNEIVDFSTFINITVLEISAYHHGVYSHELEEEDPPTPYILPSIAALFPNLCHLRIVNGFCSCFIGGITDVPATLLHVLIKNTYIRDVSPILRFGINILSFSVINNVVPVSMLVPFPASTTRVFMESTCVDDALIFPNNMISVACRQCRIPRLDGLDNADPELYCYIKDCITPYDPRYLTGLDTDRIVRHITTVNAQIQYADFGSIPTRIREHQHEHIDLANPIVVVMKCLSSNYPRRMAEFVAVTKVTTDFTPPPEIAGGPHEMWDVDMDDGDEDEDVYDDEDYYDGNDYDF